MRKKARKTHRKLMQMIALTVSVMMVFVSADGTKLFADSMQKFNDTLKDETNELKVSAQASLKTVSKGSAFKAERVEKDTALYKGIESKADDLAKGSSHRSLLAYSFTFSKNGKSYQPYGNIDVAMNWKNAISPSSYKDAQDITVYNFSLKNNKVTDVEKLSDQPYTKAEVNNEHKLKSLSFKSDQLSYVVITWTNKPVTYDHSLSYKGKDYNISLKYGDSTKINSTDRLEVKELGKNHKDYDHYSDAAAKKVINNKADADDLDVARLFDIKIIDTAGKEKEPDASVQVNFTFNKKQNNLSDYQIVHFKNNSVKNIQVLDPQSHKDNKSLSFKTDSFSLYEIVNVTDSDNDGLLEIPEGDYAIVNVATVLANNKRTQGMAIQFDGTADDNKLGGLIRDSEHKVLTVLPDNTDSIIYTANETDDSSNPFNNMSPTGTDKVTKWTFTKNGDTNTYFISTKYNNENYYLNISGDKNITITKYDVGKHPGSGFKIRKGKDGIPNSISLYKDTPGGQIVADYADKVGTKDKGHTARDNKNNIIDNSNSGKFKGFIYRQGVNTDNHASFILCKVSDETKQPQQAHIGVKKSVAKITGELSDSNLQSSNPDGSITSGEGKKVIVYTRDDEGNYYALAYGNKTDERQGSETHGDNVQWRYLKKLYNNGTSIGYRGNEDAIWTLKKEQYDGRTVFNLYDQGVRKTKDQDGNVTGNDPRQSFDSEQDEKNSRDGHYFPLILSGFEDGTYGTTIMRADYAKQNYGNDDEIEKSVKDRYPLKWYKNDDGTWKIKDEGSNKYWSQDEYKKMISNEKKFVKENPLIAGSLENTFIYGKEDDQKKKNAIESGMDDIDLNFSDKTYSSFTSGSGSRSIGYKWYFAEVSDDNKINNGGEIRKIDTVDSVSKGITINMFDYDGNSDSKGYYWDNLDRQDKKGVQGYYFGHTFIDSKNAGQDIVQNIVKKKLNDKGYPEIVDEEYNRKNNQETKGFESLNKGASLEDLFSQNNKVTSYMNCNHLFSKNIYDETGYFEYSSFNNFAHLNGEPTKQEHNFTVYDQIASPYGYYTGQNTDKDDLLSTDNDLNSSVLNSKYLERGNFLPFNDIQNNIVDGKTGNVETTQYQILKRTQQQTAETLDDVDYAPNTQLIDSNMQNMNKNDSNFGRAMYRVLHPDYRFGMTMTANFYQPYVKEKDSNGIEQTVPGKDPKQDNRPITFEFNGDDDMWVFIDDVLVLDIGGVHDAHNGKIDFSTGKVTIDTYGNGNDGINYPQTWEYNLKDLFINADGGTLTSGDAAKFDEKKPTFKANTTHTLKMFYMERGEGASNLMLRTNIQTGSLGVTKKVVDQQDKEISETNIPDVIKDRLNHTEFYFRIYDNSTSENKYVNIGELDNNSKTTESETSYYTDRNGDTVNDSSGNPIPVKTASDDGTVFILYNGYTAHFPNITSGNIKVEELPYYNQKKISDSSGNQNYSVYPFTADKSTHKLTANSKLTPLYQLFNKTQGTMRRGTDNNKYHTVTSASNTDYWVSINKDTTDNYSSDNSKNPLFVSDNDKNAGDMFEFRNKLISSKIVNIKKFAEKENGEADTNLPVAGAEYTLYPINNIATARAERSDSINCLHRNLGNSLLPNNPSDKQTVNLKNMYGDYPFYTLDETISYADLYKGNKSYYDDQYIADSAIRDNNRWRYTISNTSGVKYITAKKNETTNGYFYKEKEDGTANINQEGLELIPGVTYILKETKGAHGYNTSKDVWALLVDYDTLQTHIKCLTDGDGNELTKDDVDSYYTVTDKPGTSLPVTGQRGIVLSLLIAGAFIAYSSYRIVKKRRDDDAEE